LPSVALLVVAWKPFIISIVGMAAAGCLLAQALAYQDETERRRLVDPNLPTWRLARVLRWLTLPSFVGLMVGVLTMAYSYTG
jgi:hypothetical protein